MAQAPLRVGIVGCGGISSMYTDIYAGLHQLAHVVAVADLSPVLATNRAKALITEGKEFPDNSLIIGAPARSIRAISDQQRALNAKIINSYIERWQRYKIELMPLE